MSSVFISYTRADLGPVQDIEHGLRAAHIPVWRDQDQLYGGQRWPKALGEAIAAQDFLLLCWSAKAATSTYVELEWCTALALKKPIIPWLLDDTPLPASLRAVQAITARAPTDAIPGLLTALQQAPAVSEPAHTQQIIDQLARQPAGEPQAALEAVKQILNQSGWTVHGPVYQAAGNIIIGGPATPSTEPLPPKLLDRWQARLGLVIAVLTIVGLLADLPAKLGQWWHPQGPAGAVLDQALSGSVRDPSGQPLAGVQVNLPEFHQNQQTGPLGEFAFTVKAKKEAQVRVLAQKAGYRTYEAYATLGAKNVSFALERAP